MRLVMDRSDMHDNESSHPSDGTYHVDSSLARCNVPNHRKPIRLYLSLEILLRSLRIIMDCFLVRSTFTQVHAFRDRKRARRHRQHPFERETKSERRRARFCKAWTRSLGSTTRNSSTSIALVHAKEHPCSIFMSCYVSERFRNGEVHVMSTNLDTDPSFLPLFLHEISSKHR